MEKKSGKKIARIVAFVLVFLVNWAAAAPAFAETAPDLKGHWAEKEFSSWMEKGLITGYADGLVKPNNKITRAEFIAMINRTLNLIKTSPRRFNDVKSSDWYAVDVSKAVKAGYISGNAGRINPGGIISRQEAAVMIGRVLKLAQSEAESTGFKDAKSIPAWSRGYVGAVVKKGYLSGYPDGTFRPNGGYTRAEAVAALSRAVGQLFNKSGVYGDEKDKTTVKGNVTISNTGVTLKNTVITGNLYLTEGIGTGTVTLDNVVVKGTTTVCGGGEHSIIILNSTLGRVVIEVPDNSKVRLLAQGDTSISEVDANSVARLEEDNLTGKGFEEVKIQIPKGYWVELAGSFGNVTVAVPGTEVKLQSGTIDQLKVEGKGTDTRLNIAPEASIKKLELNAAGTAVLGSGKIDSAQINASNVSLEQKPAAVTVAAGLSGVTVANNPAVSTNNAVPPPAPVVSGGTPAGGTPSGGTSGTGGDPGAGGQGSGNNGSNGGNSGEGQQQVSTPTVSVTPGAVVAGTKVALSTSTSGADVYYTLDGSTPTRSGTKYTTPVAINTATTIKAIAMKAGMTDSNVGSFTYTLLKQPEPRFTAVTATAIKEDSINVVFNKEVGTFDPKAYVVRDDTSRSSATMAAIESYVIDGSTVKLKLSSSIGTKPEQDTLFLVPNQPELVKDKLGWALSSTGTALAIGDRVGPKVSLLALSDSSVEIKFSESVTIASKAQVLHELVIVDDGSIIPVTEGALRILSDSILIDGLAAETKYRVSLIPRGNIMDKAVVPNRYEQLYAYVTTKPGEYVSAPAASIASGNVFIGTPVMLTTKTAQADIYYTLDGSTPTSSSTKYSGPITVTTATTIKAIAVKVGMKDSDVSTFQYVLYSPIQAVAAKAVKNNTINVTFNRNVGSFDTRAYVVRNGSGRSSATIAAIMAYTIDGSTVSLRLYDPIGTKPEADSLFLVPYQPELVKDPYLGSLSSTEPALAIADRVKPTATLRALSDSTVEIKFSESVTVTSKEELAQQLNVTDTAKGSIVSITAGALTIQSDSIVIGGLAASTEYRVSIVPRGSIMDKAAVPNPPEELNTTVTTKALQVRANAPVASPASGTVDGGTAITLTTATAQADIYYTLDGSTPTSSSTKYTSPITITADTTIKAIAVKAGMSDSTMSILGYIVRITQPQRVEAPTATPASGKLTVGTAVTLKTATEGATIRYTLGGYEPNQFSTAYTAPIIITKATNIKAIALKTGVTGSAISSFFYTVVMDGTGVEIRTVPDGDKTKVYVKTTASNDGKIGIRFYDGTINRTVIADVTEAMDNDDIVSAIQQALKTDSLITAAYSIMIEISGEFVSIIPKDTTTSKNIQITVADITRAEAPISSITPGAVELGTKVALETPTSNATIYYTKDGSVPTTASTLYSTPISITTATTIRAIAVKNGLEKSDASTFHFTVMEQVAAPSASHAGGVFARGEGLELVTATQGAQIHYTLDGTVPTVSSPIYTGKIWMSDLATVTVKAIASKDGMTNSIVSTYTYQVLPKVSAPSPSINPGAVSRTASVRLNCTDTDARIYYTVNGGIPTTSSAVFTATSPAITIPTDPTVIRAIAVKTGWIDSDVGTFTYTILPLAGVPVANPAPGTVMIGSQVRLTTTTGASIYYTTDGSDPYNYMMASEYRAPITISGNMTIRAYAKGTGMESSQAGNYEYKAKLEKPLPQYEPGGVLLNTEVTFVNNSMVNGKRIDGENIRYTTDGTTPTSISALYTSPVRITENMTIQAIAVKGDLVPSDVAIFHYYILPQAQKPVASWKEPTIPAGESVSLSTATTGASIYYTLDGSIPDHYEDLGKQDQNNGILYTGPIKITQNTTIKAIAVYPDMVNSGVSEFSYTLKQKAPMPTSNVPSGEVEKFAKIELSTVAGGQIRYTLDNTTPSYANGVWNGILYEGPVEITTGTAIKAVTVKSYMFPSDVLTLTYTVKPAPMTQVAKPVISLYQGNVNITTATTGAEIYFTLDGTKPTRASTFFDGINTIPVGTLNAIAMKEGMLDSEVAVRELGVQPDTRVAVPAGSVTVVSGSAILTLSTSTSGASIYYTTNGDYPSLASPVYQEPITLSAGMTIKAIARTSSGNSQEYELCYSVPLTGVKTTVAETTPGDYGRCESTKIKVLCAPSRWGVVNITFNDGTINKTIPIEVYSWLSVADITDAIEEEMRSALTSSGYDVTADTTGAVGLVTVARRAAGRMNTSITIDRGDTGILLSKEIIRGEDGVREEKTISVLTDASRTGTFDIRLKCYYDGIDKTIPINISNSDTSVQAANKIFTALSNAISSDAALSNKITVSRTENAIRILKKVPDSNYLQVELTEGYLTGM